MSEDLVTAFQDAFSWAYENGAEPGECVVIALRRVLRILAWEMDEIPLGPEEPGRMLLTQHVLHRLGDQGAGHEREEGK